jgi:uncharacterized protein YodC (DUF2158 family)
LRSRERRKKAVADKFKAGDIVKLKSGGPNMTVMERSQFDYESETKYRCRWFDSKHQQSFGRFKEAELDIVHP